MSENENANKSVQYVVKENNNIVLKSYEYNSSTRTYVSPPTPEMFLTEDEIVEDLFKTRLTEKDLKYISEIPMEDVIGLHFSAGMWIRNTYGLWLEENPYTNLKDARADDFPDQVSHRILEKLWKRVRENNPNIIEKSLFEQYDDAMKGVDDNDF